MAGTIAFTYDRGPGPVKRVIADWVSDASAGTALATTSAKIVGRIVKSVTVPSATAAPSDNYDIALADEESVNPLAGCDDTLDNLSTSATQERYFFVEDTDSSPLAKSVHPVVCSPITVSIANAGNSKAGKLVLYVEGEILGGG